MSGKRGLLSRCPALVGCFTSRFLSTYYIAHLLYIFAYFPVREHFREHPTFHQREIYSFYLTREEQVFGMLGTLLCLQSMYLVTLDMWFSKIFGYFKLSVIVISLGVDWGWMGCNLLIGSMFWLVPQPEYRGPSRIISLMEPTFEQKVERAGPGESWLVLFYTPWAHDCAQFSPLFSELSLHFGSETLKFGKINIGVAAHSALKYNISIRPTTKQLPTLILFQHGRAVSRTPTIDPISQQVTRMVISGKNLIEYFDLETLTKRPPPKSKKKKA